LRQYAVVAIASSPRDHQGRGYMLTGPTALTFTEVASLLTHALGRTIAYQPATASGYMRHLRSKGLPLPQRIVQTVLHVGLRRGGAATVDPALTQLLARLGTPMETYIADHLTLWKQ
jgi:uncharacterized protein YbjT (DUF2867 family)